MLAGHLSQVATVAFSPGGKELASGDRMGNVLVWDIQTGTATTLRPPRSHQASLTSLTYHKRLPLLAWAELGRAIYVWRHQRGQRKQPSKQSWAVTKLPQAAKHLAFHPKERWLAAALGNEIHLFHPSQPKRRLIGHKTRVLALTFSKGGEELLSLSQDGSLHQWRWYQEKRTRSLQLPHNRRFSVAVFSLGLRYLLTGEGQHLQVWDWHKRTKLRQIRGDFIKLTTVAFSPKGDEVLAGGWGSFLKKWRWRWQRTRPKNPSHGAPGNDLAFHPGSQTLFSASWDYTVRMWDRQEGTSERLSKQTSGCLTIDTSSDGRHVAVGTWSGKVQLWQWHGTREQRLFQAHKGAVWRLRFAQDSQTFATGSEAGIIRIWDAATGALLKTLSGHKRRIHGLGFHPTLPLLASASYDGTIRLWNLHANPPTSQSVFTSSIPLRDVHFSKEGDSLYFADDNGHISSLHLASKKTKRIGQHKQRVHQLSLHPSGQLLASASADHTVKVWNLKTGKSRVLHGHAKEANAVRFDPSGRYLSSTGDDSVVYTWRVKDWMPMWRAPFFDHQTRQLVTHKGWFQLTQQGRKRLQAKHHWQRALAKRALMAQLSPSRKWLCLRTPRSVELWDLSQDRRFAEHRQRESRQVLALPFGCVFRDEALWLLTPKGKRQLLPKVRALWRQGSTLYAIEGTSLLRYLPAKRRWLRHPVPRSAQLVLKYKDKELIGFSNGHLSWRQRGRRERSSQLFFEGLPSSEAKAFQPGPKGTLLVGFANGVVMQWDATNGGLLNRGHLRHPLAHFSLRGQELLAISTHGTVLRWDLAMFAQPICMLLRDIWQRIPTIWKQRRALFQQPPTTHPCHRPQTSDSEPAR